ncbi:MAG: glycosyltransferase family 4 protein [Candidatus Scalindua sp.]
MTTLKVTILTTSYPLTSKSTSGIFVARLIDYFPSGISTTVITPSMGKLDPCEKIDRNNIAVFRYAPGSWEILAHRPGGIPVALRKNKLLYLLLPIFLTAMLLKCIRIARNSDVIHANWAITGLVAGIAGWLLDRPVITTLRGEDITRAKKNFLDRSILKWCINLNSHIVAVSESIKMWVVDNIPGTDHKITVIANGVEQKLLELNSSETENDSEIRILTIGSLIERKGIDQIIKAVASIKDKIPANLTIIGMGPEKKKLEKLAKNFNMQDKVKFVGEIMPKNVLKYLSNADMFILASHSEGRPNVILEAMASGLPVIATDIEGSNELVSHKKTGLLFRDRNTLELANCILELSNNEPYRKELSKNARKFIIDNNLLWTQTALSYLNLYQLVLTRE